LLGTLELPCTNPECPGYTLGTSTSFHAFGMALTGPLPEITLFDTEAEAQRLRSKAAHSNAELPEDDWLEAEYESRYERD